MNDLNTINRLNGQACVAHRAKELSSYNKHVVIERAGLHYVNAHGFSDKAGADAKLAELAARKDSSFGEYLAPRNAAELRQYQPA